MTENDAWGDDVYQPDGSETQDDEGLLDAGDTLDGPPADPYDTGYSPPDRPWGAGHTGETAEEQEHGETLDERLAEEVPDLAVPDGDGIGDTTDTDGEALDGEVGDRRAGRLLSPDEDPGSEDWSAMDAEDAGLDGGAASAEEAAVHVIDD
ncbi:MULTISPECIES: DUF5709 domain-containing protein [unclassified Streptomyces]|uniref:DUF5709 domain-containing protein n=1 Tax=unclassified Streptomyces TaxID=2593676 RepID=UPI0004C43207